MCFNRGLIKLDCFTDWKPLIFNLVVTVSVWQQSGESA